jgi:hypothetical protein
MIAVKAYYDGHAFVPATPVTAVVNQEAIITLLDSESLISPKKDWLLRFIGKIPHEDCLVMETALEETEKVDPNDW